MNPLVVGPLLEIGKSILSKVLPDPEAQSEAKLKLLQLQQAGDFKELESNLQLIKNQVETNKIEAQSEGLLKSGWRPFIGWVCGAGLVYQMLLRPMFNGLSVYLGHGLPMPALDNDTLMWLITGLLGLGTMRTVERVKTSKA